MPSYDSCDNEVTRFSDEIWGDLGQVSSMDAADLFLDECFDPAEDITQLLELDEMQCIGLDQGERKQERKSKRRRAEKKRSKRKSTECKRSTKRRCSGEREIHEVSSLSSVASESKNDPKNQIFGSVEFNQQFEKSLSSLARSMERSEISRSQILKHRNSSNLSSFGFSGFLNGSADTLTSGLAQSKSHLQSYVSQMSTNTI